MDFEKELDAADQEIFMAENTIAKLKVQVSDLKEVLEGVVWQFGTWKVCTYMVTAGLPGTQEPRLAITSGGLSDLGAVFSALGWEDPHFSEAIDAEACQWYGCLAQSTSGQSLPETAWDATSWPPECLDREIPYARLCGRHAEILRRMEHEKDWLYEDLTAPAGEVQA